MVPSNTCMTFLKSNWLFVVAIVLLGFLIALTLNTQPLFFSLPPSPEPNPRRFDRLHITDLQYTAMVNGHEFILTVQEVTHAKRTLGPLTVNPLKELQLIGVALRLGSTSGDIDGSTTVAPSSSPSSTEDTPSSPAQPRIRMGSFMNSLPEIFKDMFRAKDLGFISRVQIHTFTIHASMPHNTSFSLIANKVELGTSQGAILFSKGVSLETPSRQKLVANEAEWQPKAKTLLIPGTFVLQTQSKESAGRNGAFSFTSSGTLQGPLPPSS